MFRIETNTGNVVVVKYSEEALLLDSLSWTEEFDAFLEQKRIDRSGFTISHVPQDRSVTLHLWNGPPGTS